VERGKHRCCDNVIGGFKLYDAITKHNSARGANTMEFPKGKFAGGTKYKHNGENNAFKMA
jgi:hypothetical protein